MNFSKLLSVTASAIAFLTFQGAANAQTAPAPAPAAEEADEDVIIITAEKRAQNLQDVPVAVTAFTATMRDKIGISTVQDVANFTPGVSYQTGLDRIYVRGIGRSTNNLASDGGTAIYSDGVYTSSSYSAATPSIFVERIEVLRGPQGTLYGRNAIGGAINVISKRPDRDFTSEVRGQAGSFDRYVAEGRISVPLSDQLRFSLTGSYQDQGEGYFRNASGNESEGQNGYSTLIDAQIDADLTENLNVWVRARSSLYDYSPRSTASLTPYSTTIIPAGSLGPSAQWAAIPGNALNVVTNGPLITQNPASLNDLRVFNGDTHGHQTLSDSYDVAGQVSWDFAGMNLKYITGAQRYLYTQISDFDGTNVSQYTIPVTTNANPLYNNPTCAAAAPALPCATVQGASASYYIEDKRWWSHELNLSSDNDSAVQWLTGVYLYKEMFDQPVYFPTTGISNTRVSNPAACLNPSAATPCSITIAQAPNPTGYIYYQDQKNEQESYAIFGQADWAFLDQWKLTGGLRYTHDEKVGVEYYRSICYGLSSFLGCPSLQAVGSAATAGDITTIDVNPYVGVLDIARRDPLTGLVYRPYGDTWDATTGTLGLEYNPTEDTMLYAKYSRGYKAGGFNAGTGGANPRTDAEKVDAYEFGVKSQPLDGLTANASLFYYDYVGRQTPLTVVPTTGPTRTEFVNVPKSSSTGFELETTYNGIDGLQILANYAYLDAVVEEGCCYVDGADTLAVQPGATPSGPLVGTSQGQNVAGQQLPNSPKHRITVNGNYTFYFDPGSLNLSASYIWKDESYSSFFNRDYTKSPAYDQVDLRATWSDSEDRYKVIVFGRNVFDEAGYDLVSGTARAGTIYKSYSLTPPRTVGVELQAKF